MKTYTVYVVAKSPAEAEELLANERTGRFGAYTFFSRAAARLMRNDLAPLNPGMHVYPVRLTIDAGHEAGDRP